MARRGHGTGTAGRASTYDTVAEGQGGMPGLSGIKDVSATLSEAKIEYGSGKTNRDEGSDGTDYVIPSAEKYTKMGADNMSATNMDRYVTTRSELGAAEYEYQQNMRRAPDSSSGQEPAGVSPSSMGHVPETGSREGAGRTGGDTGKAGQGSSPVMSLGHGNRTVSTPRYDRYTETRSGIGAAEHEYQQNMRRPHGREDEGAGGQGTFPGSRYVGSGLPLPGQEKQGTVRNTETVPDSGSRNIRTAETSLDKNIRTVAEKPDGSFRNTGNPEKTSGEESIRTAKAADDSNTWIHTDDSAERGGLITRQDAEFSMPKYHGAGNTVAGRSQGVVGVYSGGRTGDAYRKGQKGGVTSVTSYVSIFGDKELADKCGVIYDPNLRRLTENSIITAKAGKLTKKKIEHALLLEGYNAHDASKFADAAMASVNGGKSESETYLHGNGQRMGARSLDKDSVSNHVSRTNTGGGFRRKNKVEIRKSGDGFIIYKPIGMSSRDITVKIDKSMRRVNRGTYNYASGSFMQGTQEAGQGINKAEQAVRIAKLVLPTVSLHVNKQFEKEIKEHLQNFIVFPTGKGPMQQWNIEEMRSHLTNTLGLDPKLFERCHKADDFANIAQKLIKDDRKFEEINSIGKLTKEQRNFLQNLTKSRAATKDERLRMLNQVISSYGAKMEYDTGHFAVRRTKGTMKKANKIFGKKNVPADLAAALEERMMFDKKMTYKDSKTLSRGKRFQLLMFAKKSIEKSTGEAGQGLNKTTRLASVTVSSVRAYVKIKWLENMLARESAQKALFLTAKAGLLAAKGMNVVGLKGAGDAVAKSARLLEKGSVEFRGVNRRVNSGVRNLKGNAESWLRSHNPLSMGANKVKQIIGSKIRNTKFYDSKIMKGTRAVLGKIGKFKGGLAELFRKVGFIKNKIIAFLGGAVLLLILVILLSYLLNSISAIVSSIFNLDGQDYDTKQYHANNLKNYFEADMDEVASMAESLHDPSYDPTTNPHVDHVDGIYIEYEDYKDYEKYKYMLDEEEAEDFVQSSNNGEIMSMAMIRYDHDLGTLKDKWFSDDPKKNKQFKVVEEYMRQLYYGSHQLSVRVELQTFSSSDVTDGNVASEDEEYEYTVYTVYATYKTYYFDYLFDCPLMNEPQREISKQSLEGIPTGTAQSWDSIYYTLRQQGISHNGAAGIMSNFAHESGDPNNWRATHGPDPSAGVPNGEGPYGICQWTSCGGRKARLLAWCESKGFDYSSTSAQLAYMLYEISNFTAYGDTMSAVYSDSKSAYDIANVFGNNFEVYGGGQETSRGNLAEEIASYYAGYKDSWEDLMSLGDQIAEISLSANGKIHYTQGTEDYVGYRTFDLATAEGGYGDRSCGTDCSGFVVACYREAGYTGSLPTYTGGYSSYGSKILSTAEAVPGDVAWRSGHAGIVTGGGKTMELHKCYFSNDGNCARDCSPGNLTNFSCVYRLWQ